MSHLAAIGTAALLLAQAVAAADGKGQFGVRGAGLITCAVYEREREARSPVYHVVGAWLDGYVTGINQYADATYDVLSFESTELLAALVSENCRKNPDAVVFAVLRAVVEQAGKNRLRSPSRKVEVTVDERKVLLYDETLKRIQQALASRGFYRGPVTGTYDESTQKAMKAFQSSSKLQPTGFPDQLTLWRLLHAGS